MKKPLISSGNFAVPSRSKTLVFAVCACAVLAAAAHSAHAQATDPTLPNHLTIGNQTFDASVTGLRAYVETIRASKPQLYAQLAPDVEHLESEQATASVALVAGLVASLASAIYAVAGESNCQEPSLSDPDFAAKSAASGSCTDHNIRTLATFSVISVAALGAGVFGAMALAPSRSEILDVLNKNNRLNPEPLHLELGYDPTHQLAFASAALTF